ncbi:hypothetical protein DET57_108126 [Klebsiella oxytoca]|uniref:Uncharacterized protein n=1 Tax=Klebsiella oxytoca TaxID=571 RepID=A0A318FNZ9_KLEOX|nr:hypothetical protein DET57_108126 [Klebsiella oxytoca]
MIVTKTQKKMQTPGCYTRHTSSCICVGFPRSHQSLTSVMSKGLPASPRYSAYGLAPSGQHKLRSRRKCIVLQFEFFMV